jgi:hypothetical protein
MPFTVSIGDDRGRNGLAPCAPLIANELWDKQPWEVKKEHCKACPFRFTGRPSCNLDFMTVSDTDTFKRDIATALAWTAANGANWPSLNGSIYEVDFAYYYLGLEIPSPKKVMSLFIESCAFVTPNEKFWKGWNYRWVEHKEGKPALRIEVTADVKEDVDKIALNIIEPQKYSGKRLLHLYAASAVLLDIADSIGLKTLGEISRNLLESSRRAITANASLEIK